MSGYKTAWLEAFDRNVQAVYQAFSNRPEARQQFRELVRQLLIPIDDPYTYTFEPIKKLALIFSGYSNLLVGFNPFFNRFTHGGQIVLGGRGEPAVFKIALPGVTGTLSCLRGF